MDEINLHFNQAIFPRITSAHNLLAAMIDNHIHWGNALDIDPRRIAWRRADSDMNDRALREIVVGMGGPANGFVRQDAFDINGGFRGDGGVLPQRDDRGTGRTARPHDRRPDQGQTPVTASDLKASGAMAALLLRALQPNSCRRWKAAPR